MRAVCGTSGKSPVETMVVRQAGLEPARRMQACGRAPVIGRSDLFPQVSTAPITGYKPQTCLPISTTAAYSPLRNTIASRTPVRELFAKYERDRQRQVPKKEIISALAIASLSIFFSGPGGACLESRREDGGAWPGLAGCPPKARRCSNR